MKLNKVYKVAVDSPLRAQIKEGIALNKVYKKAVNTPLRQEIKAGRKLRRVSTPRPKVAGDAEADAALESAEDIDTPLDAMPEDIDIVADDESDEGIAASEVEPEALASAQAKDEAEAEAEAEVEPVVEAEAEAEAEAEVEPVVEDEAEAEAEAEVPPTKRLTPRTPERYTPALNVNGMTCKELRAELAERGLETSGLKADLQRRLKAALEPAPTSPKRTKVEVESRDLSVIAEVELDSEDEAEAEAEAEDSLTESDIAAMKVVQLKEALAARNLETTGRKAELQARLRDAVFSSEPAVAAAEPEAEAATEPAAEAEAEAATAAWTEAEVLAMKVAELRSALSSLNMEATGRKAELQKRLLACVAEPAVADAEPTAEAAAEAEPEAEVDAAPAAAAWTEAEVKGMKVAELRDALSSVSLETTGRKAELQKRLLAFIAGDAPAEAAEQAEEEAPAPKRAKRGSTRSRSTRSTRSK